jgi:NhaA family Na+:H+ antiporter
MLHRVRKIFELEASTGILLMLATIVALIISNSESYHLYNQFFAIKAPLNLSIIGISKNLTLHGWINDGLMVIFFFLVGMELKEELIAGELSSKEKAMLPIIGACGGVIIPALIFYFFNFNYESNLKGFAIPTATDIAFAYGVICLFGNKISKSLKVFLISLAIFDDLNAIIIIAFFYSQNIVLIYIIFAFLLIFVLAILNLTQHTKIFSYLILGVLLWLMVLKSGIHPTIAGVILAMFIPRQKNILHGLIKKIAPTANFLILPIFAFANGGVRIEEFSKEIFSTPLVLGITLGLFIGKQLGVMLFSFIAIKFGLTHLPKNIKNESSWLEFYGVSILTGIGFTMSFFIGSLAFIDNAVLFDQVKIGVLTGSFLSTIFGIIIIFLSLKKNQRIASID